MKYSALQWLAAIGLILATTAPARADDLRGGGKLVLTDGVTSVEGSSGGGLATWALIAGNETDAGIGATAHVTLVTLPDFTLTSFGGAIGYRDRVEISYAHQDFDTRDFGATLGLGRGYTFSQDVVGVKLRLVGDAVYDQDRMLPQIAIGAQYKRANRGAVIAAVGGKASSGVDFYVSATKVILSQGIGARRQRPLDQGQPIRPARVRRRQIVGLSPASRGIGREIAQAQPAGRRRISHQARQSRLRPRGSTPMMLFAAWAVTRNVTLTAAYADLGSIATSRKQRGAVRARSRPGSRCSC